VTGAGDAGGELDRGVTGGTDVLLGLCAFGVALVVRSLTWPSVFTAEGIRLVGPDAHYHLRRIVWTVENFPKVLTRDSYVSFPNGGEPIWTPFFEQAIAWVAWIVVGPGDVTGVERVAVWVPPLLGSATVAATFFIGQRFFGRRVGLIAAAFVCVLPSPVHYSQVGLVDHHVAVGLIVTGLLAALLASVSPRQPGLRAPVVLGAAIGASLLIWPGTLLHVGLAQTVLTLSVVSAADARTAASRAGNAAVAHGVAFLLVAPFAIGRTWAAWGDMSPVVLSGFQPIWLGLPAIGFGACAVAWRPGVGQLERSRRAGLLALAVAVPVLSALVLPSVRGGVADAVRWFFRGESFQSVVAESLPLFSDGRSFTLYNANGMLTPLFYALPLMLFALVTAKRRVSSHRVLALWCLALFSATVAQQRFANSLAVPWALTIACSVDLALRRVAARAKTTRWTLVVAFAVGGVVLLAPLVLPHVRGWGTAQRAFAGERVHPPESSSPHESLVAVARWLGDHSPATDGWLSQDRPPSYGVLTAWGDGHVTRYVSQRPTVQDNFGDDVGSDRFEAAERYFASRDERPALEIAADLRVRYVLVREAGSGHAPRPYEARSMLVRLHRLRGSAGSLHQGDAPVFAPALVRHRLIYESPPHGEEPGRFKLYEIVKGAHVVGLTSPGEVVEARLALEGENEQRFEYRAHGRADPEGRYQLRLPYPTVPFTSQFAAASPYALEAAGVIAPFTLDDAAVREGLRVEGPTLVP
jgi:dolichyl-diphosphooligosaccharide--protein glycosyltransferase